MTAKDWTLEENATLQTLRENGKTRTDMSEILERTKASVSRKLHELGFTKKHAVDSEPYPRPFGTEFSTESKGLLNPEKHIRLTWRVVGVVPVNDEKKILREVLCCIREEVT